MISFFFTQQELLDQIKQFLEDSVDKPKYLDSRKVLDEISAQQGILVERVEDVYSFSHLTLQEYLVAQHISHTDDFDQGYEVIVRQHLTQQRWREVLLLVPGLLPKADKVLQLMHQIAVQEISSSALQRLLLSTEEVTANAEHEFSPTVRRSIAIESVLVGLLTCTSDRVSELAIILIGVGSNASALVRALTSDSDHTKPINLISIFTSASKHASYLASALTQIHDLVRIYNSSINFDPLLSELESTSFQLQNSQISPEQFQTIAIHLSQLISEAVNLNSVLLSLSQTDLKSLGRYLYINALIVRCKQAAVRVSRNVWEEIESRILLPPNAESLVLDR